MTVLADLRNSIACDLHDEVGSGLGSIAILAELLADESLSDEERRAIAARITSTSKQLSESLGDIVWSLRGDAGTVGDVAARLRERANGLFAHGGTDISIDVAPALQHVALDPDLRRAVQLVAQEALHNAAKHAQARHVKVELGIDERGCFLRIADNGRGFATGHSRPGGVGLTSMARRAHAAGAQFDLHSVPGKGTSMIMRFQPTPASATPEVSVQH